jgi:biopolymer transport protein ExbD
MSDDVEVRLRSAYETLAPEPGCEVDLSTALATAPQEAVASRVAWARRLAVPLAASLLVVGAWWWGNRPSGEAPAGPDNAKEASSTLTIRVVSSGAVGYSLSLGPDRFNIVSKMSFADPEKEFETASALEKAISNIADAVPRDADGTSTLRLVLAADASAKWAWVSQVMMLAATAKVADIAFADPADPKTTIAQPLPNDAGLHPAPADTVAWRVVLRNAVGIDCATIAVTGVLVNVTVPGIERPRMAAGTLLVEGAATNAPTLGPVEELRKKSRDTLDRLSESARGLLARGKPVAAQIDAPPDAGGTSCVPYGAVFDVLAALKAAGIETIHFAGVAAPIRPPTPTTSMDANAELVQKRIRGAHFEDATIAQVATYLSTVTGLHFVVSPKAGVRDVKINVPTLADVSVRELLDLVTTAVGLRWKLRDYGIVEIREKSEESGEGR